MTQQPQYRQQEYSALDLRQLGRELIQGLPGKGMAMTGDASASDDRYEKTTAFAWTERAFELLEAGMLRAEIQQPHPGVRVAHVWGQCPRCGHHLDDWQPLSAVTGLIGARRPGSATHDTAEVEPIDVGCGCGVTHPGAPVDMTGCGVSFRIELEPIPSRDASRRDS